MCHTPGWAGAPDSDFQLLPTSTIIIIIIIIADMMIATLWLLILSLNYSTLYRTKGFLISTFDSEQKEGLVT